MSDQCCGSQSQETSSSGCGCGCGCCSCGGGCNCGGSCDCGCSCCGGSCDCGCACCGGGGKFQRRFITKAEKIARLEAYKKELELEIQGIQEEIDRINKS